MKIPIIPEDKANHVVYGAVSCVVAQLLLRACLKTPIMPTVLGALFAVAVVAALKEAYDDSHYESHTPSWLDFLSTLGGGFLAVAPAVMWSA